MLKGAPYGSKFFPFRVDPFSEGTLFAKKQAETYKSYLPCLKRQEIFQVYPWSVRVAEQLTLLTSDNKVQGSNPTRDRVHLLTV